MLVTKLRELQKVGVCAVTAMILAQPPFSALFSPWQGAGVGREGREGVLQVSKEPTWMSWPEGLRGRGRDIQDKPYYV